MSLEVANQLRTQLAASTDRERLERLIAIEEAPPALTDLPQAGRYGAILADPPWQFKTFSAKGRDRCPDAPMTRAAQRNNDPARHYHTMSLEDIKAMPVGSLAARDCLLFLWAVDPLIPQALEVGKAWGFTFKTIAFYWAKTRRVTSRRGDAFDDPIHKQFPMGTGYWTRANPETCLLFSKGKPTRLSAGVRKLIVSPRREHSRKPDEVTSYVEALVAGPYVELFARQSRPGWDSWGNQTNKFDVAA